MPNPTKFLRDHHWLPLPTPPDPATTQPLALLLPPLTQLAGDAWVLAQKSPALPADPALVEVAGRLLKALRRLGPGAPEFRLLPRTFAPGIRLHALAPALRQMLAALAALGARDTPPPPRSTDDEIADITRLMALFLRDIADKAVENRGVVVPRHLRARRAPQADPPPPGGPPAPRPHIRKAMRRRHNSARRTRRLGSARPPAGTETPQNRPLPRIR